MQVFRRPLADKVGWWLHARCQDVLMVSASRVACPLCQIEFTVPWVAQPEDRVAACPGCGWRITAGAFHMSFRHQDLLGNAPTAFTEFVTRFPVARSYEERMRLIDRVVHAIHVTGGVTARNLIEGRPRRILAVLDALAGSGDLTCIDVDEAIIAGPASDRCLSYVMASYLIQLSVAPSMG